MRVDFGAYLLCALLLLTLPLSWLLAALAAALFHELCHMAAVWLVGGKLYGIHISAGGARLEAGPMSPGKSLICSAAGPLGGLLLLPLARWIPRTAFCALAQSMFNLLPIYPLDGGRMLRCAAQLLAPMEAWEQICLWVERSTTVLLLLLAIYGTFFLHLGIFPILLTGILVLKKNSLQRRETRGTIGLPYTAR